MAYVIETDVPFGNACDVSVSVDGDQAVVQFASDPHGGPECLWFCFRMRRSNSLPPGGQVKLLWRHFDNVLGGHDPRSIQPVVRVSGGDWQRLGPGTVESLPDGRQAASWLMPGPDEFADVALCYPYGPEHVENLVDQTGGYWQCDTIGLSQNARAIRRLSNDYGQPEGNRPGLFLIARQHSGETPGSWVLDGFLREIADAGAASPLVWAVPLSNIDGIVQGDYGKDNFPYDLNRAWDCPPMRHETLVIQRDMKRWHDRCQPVLAVDFHAPGACETDGVYFYLPDPDRFEIVTQRARLWAEHLSQAIGSAYCSQQFAQVATYRSRWETSNFATHCASQEDLCALAMETPYARARDIVLARDTYQTIGRNMAKGVIAQLPQQ